MLSNIFEQSSEDVATLQQKVFLSFFPSWYCGFLGLGVLCVLSHQYSSPLQPAASHAEAWDCNDLGVCRFILSLSIETLVSLVIVVFQHTKCDTVSNKHSFILLVQQQPPPQSQRQREHNRNNDDSSSRNGDGEKRREKRREKRCRKQQQPLLPSTGRKTNISPIAELPTITLLTTPPPPPPPAAAAAPAAAPPAAAAPPPPAAAAATWKCPNTNGNLLLQNNLGNSCTGNLTMRQNQYSESLPRQAGKRQMPNRISCRFVPTKNENTRECK